MDKTELTIERNALASLVLTLVLTGVIVWMNAMGVLAISHNAEQMVRSNAIADEIETLMQHLVDVETGERGYIITGREVYLEPFTHGLAMVYQQRDELARLLADEPSEQGRLAELTRRIDAKIAVSKANVQARKLGFEAARSRVLEGAGKREMGVLRKILDEMTGVQFVRRQELLLQRKTALDEMEFNIIFAAAVAIAVLIYLHLRLIRMMKLRHKSEQHLQFMATHDPLTGLPNRRLMLEHVDQAMQRCKRHNKSMALLFLDLNGFKPVNDQYGHKAGDDILKQVAHRLSAAMRASDRVARFGGDEFVVLAEDIKDKEDVCGIVGKVDEEIFRPFQLKEAVKVTISTSIGVAIYPRDAEDMESLLRIADTAMYEAKKSASNCFCREQRQLRRCVLTSDGEK